jgi:outer membrane protein assembly factor BamB
LTSTVTKGARLYASAGDSLYAFDRTGKTNCGPPPASYGGFAGSPFCQPLWSSTVGAALEGTPSVGDGYVYVGDADGTLSAVPERGCGASATCAPAWTATTGGAIESSVAVTPTTVFVGSDNGKLYAFPSLGCGASTCQPLWTATTGGPVQSSPSVANGIV